MSLEGTDLAVAPDLAVLAAVMTAAMTSDLLAEMRGLTTRHTGGSNAGSSRQSSQFLLRCRVSDARPCHLLRGCRVRPADLLWFSCWAGGVIIDFPDEHGPRAPFASATAQLGPEPVRLWTVFADPLPERKIALQAEV